MWFNRYLDVSDMRGLVRYERLMTVWLQQTNHLSSPKQIMQHDAVQRLVDLQDIAVGMTIGRLARGDVQIHYMLLLREITGENPVPAEDAGRVRAMVEWWLGCGHMKGWLVE